MSLHNDCIDFQIDSDYVPKTAASTGLEGYACSARQISTNSMVSIRKINIDDETDLHLLLSELRVMRHFKGSPQIFSPSASAKKAQK